MALGNMPLGRVFFVRTIVRKSRTKASIEPGVDLFEAPKRERQHAVRRQMHDKKDCFRGPRAAEFERRIEPAEDAPKRRVRRAGEEIVHRVPRQPDHLRELIDAAFARGEKGLCDRYGIWGAGVEIAEGCAGGGDGADQCDACEIAAEGEVGFD